MLATYAHVLSGAKAGLAERMDGLDQAGQGG